MSNFGKSSVQEKTRSTTVFPMQHAMSQEPFQQIEKGLNIPHVYTSHLAVQTRAMRSYSTGKNTLY